jgi:hypothetical protein
MKKTISKKDLRNVPFKEILKRKYFQKIRTTSL